jgi:hypothetical protein
VIGRGRLIWMTEELQLQQMQQMLIESGRLSLRE